MFSLELEANAFRAENGEFGWTRSQIPLVIDILLRDGHGILGGELWWVRDEIGGWDGLFASIPQRRGAPAVYSWETKRGSGEPWLQFIERSAADSLAAVERWPAPEDLPPDLAGRILYNLTWVSENEYEEFPTGPSGVYTPQQ
jgi:hypothetical protein